MARLNFKHLLVILCGFTTANAWYWKFDSGVACVSNAAICIVCSTSTDKWNCLFASAAVVMFAAMAAVKPGIRIDEESHNSEKIRYTNNYVCNEAAPFLSTEERSRT